MIAGWSSPVARQAHNLKVVGSNPTPATNLQGFFNTKNPFLLAIFNILGMCLKINASMQSSEMVRYFANKNTHNSTHKTPTP